MPCRKSGVFFRRTGSLWIYARSTQSNAPSRWLLRRRRYGLEWLMHLEQLPMMSLRIAQLSAFSRVDGLSVAGMLASSSSSLGTPLAKWPLSWRRASA